MRMAELSERSGVANHTIRFYIREGLLPAGTPTHRNQASYDDTHLRTLRLIRTLVDVAGLSTVRVREVLNLIRTEDSDLSSTLSGVQYALTPPLQPADDAALAQVEALVTRRRWAVRADNPARVSLAHALSTLQRLGYSDMLAHVERYAEVADDLAVAEVAALLEQSRTAQAAAEGVIVYDILGDALLSALRRLAQESHVIEHRGPDAQLHEP